MNIAAIASLSLSVTCLALSGFIFKNAKSRLHSLWALFNLSIGIWGAGIFLACISTNPDYVFLAWQFAHAGGFFSSAFFFRVVTEYCDLKKRNFLIFCYVQATIFFILNLFGITGYEVTKTFDPLYYIHIKNWLYVPITAFWFYPVIYGHILLFKSFQHASGNRRNQLKYLFIAMFIGFSGGGQHFLPVYGINVYPYGNFLVAVYTVIASYAIFKHKLLDIEVVVRRAAVFAGLFAFVYGVFMVVTVLGQEFFKSTLGWNQWLALVPTVFIIIFVHRPLENFLTNATERFLFQKKYDYRELLRTFTNEILTVLDLQKLMEQTIAGLIKIIKLESASVLLLDKDAKVYKMMASTGVKDKNLTFKEDDTLISSLKATHQPIAQDKTSDKIEGRSALKDEFKSLNARLCLPILLHDNLIGVLCLGMKKSGEDYNQDDMDVLLTLARAEAIAISNAQLFDELSKTQAEAAQREKMAVIGTLAAGINHEICNPLGIVRGHCEMYLLNIRDGFYKEKSQEEMLKISAEIMNKVIKETDRATGITKKLSSFAKPSKRSDFEEVYIEKEVGEVLGLIGHDLQLSNVDVQTDFPKDFPVIVGDKKQIQEVLFNIIRNAAQAMDKKQGKIVVSGFSENGSTVVRIADNGAGIPQDKIDQIFNPFYTTKAPGKGTGLGLFIVKQVVERNKGTIAVQSEMGVGTTFTLRFPAP